MGTAGPRGQWARPSSSAKASGGCCWPCCRLAGGAGLRASLISISSCESPGPLYPRQTPGIIPQQASIVILSGSKRLGLRSPARPHWLPMRQAAAGSPGLPAPALLSPSTAQSQQRSSAPAKLHLHHYLCLKTASPSAGPKSAPSSPSSWPGWGRPMLLSLAPAQTLLWDAARLPPRKNRGGKRAESSNLASLGLQPWAQLSALASLCSPGVSHIWDAPGKDL